MFFASAPVALIGGYFLRLGDAITMIVVGVSLLLSDLAFRLLINKDRPRFWGKTTGGYFLFVPVWVLGLFVIVLNIINLAGGLK